MFIPPFQKKKKKKSYRLSIKSTDGNYKKLLDFKTKWCLADFQNVFTREKYVHLPINVIDCYLLIN